MGDMADWQLDQLMLECEYCGEMLAFCQCKEEDFEDDPEDFNIGPLSYGVD